MQLDDRKISTDTEKEGVMIFFIYIIVMPAMAYSMSSFAADATSNPHPTDFEFHVINVDNANIVDRAMTLDPSGIPDCGANGALMDTGEGFSCMIPAQGQPGLPGVPGSQGPPG